MRAKCLALIIAGVVLSAVSYAQDYSIRANRGLNLRAAPSLNADIAETVSTGTVLQVGGKQGSWLQINRISRVVWLADWVNFSRVEGGAPDQTGSQPASSAPANVDNCCFIDRQCHNDQEWTDGYWAFQNNQCGAPAQSQTQQSPSESSRPRIEGSASFSRRIEAALDLMQRSAREWYDYVSRNVDLILEVPDTYPDCSSYSAFVYFEPARNVYVETCMAFSGPGSKGGSVYMAGILAHEACHRRHQHERIVYPGGIWEEELECTKPAQAVRRVLDPAERYVRSNYAPEFVLERLRASNCFAKINSYEEFFRVLENFYNHQGADYTC